MPASDFASKVQEELINPRSLSNGSTHKLGGHGSYVGAQTIADFRKYQIEKITRSVSNGTGSSGKSERNQSLVPVRSAISASMSNRADQSARYAALHRALNDDKKSQNSIRSTSNGRNISDRIFRKSKGGGASQYSELGKKLGNISREEETPVEIRNIIQHSERPSTQHISQIMKFRGR